MATYKPRVISLNKRPGQTFGFYLRAEQSEEGHLIRCLEMGGPAELAGMKDGDRIVRVNGTFVDGLKHSEVIWTLRHYCTIIKAIPEVIQSTTHFLTFTFWLFTASLEQVVDLVRNSGASVTFHILDESSYKQAKALGVNLSDPQSTLVTNGPTKGAPKPKLCYLVKSSSGFGFSICSVTGEMSIKTFKLCLLTVTLQLKSLKLNKKCYMACMEVSNDKYSWLRNNNDLGLMKLNL